MLDSRLIKAKEEDFLETNRSIANHMLEGKKEIHIKEFFGFREDLKTALRHYEFHNYEVSEDGSISAEDFSKSLLTCLPIKTSQLYVSRIHSLNLTSRVSFKEFCAFQAFMEDAEKLHDKI
jgi:hypothetical protein